MCLSHYKPLHRSQFYSNKNTNEKLEMSEFYADTLVRFPIYNDLVEEQVFEIIDKTIEFFTII
jgi:dTDP-4-amino-4,6-dideoxygalactose transaminase